jgi:alpha-tubulin suppressor-like RCC1 family protein
MCMAAVVVSGLLGGQPAAAGVVVAPADANVLAWGGDGGGGLGDGLPFRNQSTPVTVRGLGAASGITAVSAGWAHSLALRSDGSVVVWGLDNWGQLGDGGGNVDQPSPVPVIGLGPGSAVVAVSAGAFHNLAVRADGSVLAWGMDDLGQLGDGGANADQPVPVEVSGLGPGSGVVAVAAGFWHSLALRADGSVVAWGHNWAGQLGTGDDEVDGGTGVPEPVAVSGLGAGSGVVGLAAGAQHSVAVASDGSVLAWGAGQMFGFVPEGTDNEQLTPAVVPGLAPGSGAVAVSAGASHTLVARSDGSVAAWGADDRGQLGDSATHAGRAGVVEVDGLGSGSGVVAVAAGGAHSLALRADGSVLAWGFDQNSQLGDGGADIDQPVPVPVHGLGAGSGVVAVDATEGSGHSIALKGGLVGLPPAAEFTGDGATDRSVYRGGAWYVEGRPARYLGLPGHVPVPADYTGDGTTDLATYRDGAWFVEDQPPVYFGLAGDVPVPGDYDGDGHADTAVFRNGAWHVQGQPTAYLGLPGHIPVPADYDGNGTTDRAVFVDGAWSVEGHPTVFFGLAGDIPVPGDYDGDGATDPAVYRPSTGQWFVLDGGVAVTSYGLGGDQPQPGDYDGDGTTDKAVYRPATGQWFVLGGTPEATSYGLAGDIALPLSAAIRSASFP